MAIITTAAFGKAVYPHPFTTWLGEGFDLYEDQVSLICKVIDSDQSINEITLVSMMGGMQLTTEGEANPYDDMMQQVTGRYTSSEYRLGYQVTKTMIRDGKGFEIVMKGTKALGNSYRDTRNIIGFNVLNNGFNSSILSADGATFLSASHATTAATLTNLLATPAPLSEASLEQCRIEMKNIRDDRGLRMRVRPRKLVVSAANEFVAARILDNTEWRPGTADRDINVIASKGIYPEGYVVADYLLDNVAYHILTNVQDDGLIFWDRQKLEHSNDTHFDTDNFRAKCHARMTSYVGEWRCAFSTPGQ